jgi:hypothetical protein
MKIARPAARKSSGKTKPTKSGPARQGSKRIASESTSTQPSQSQNPRRRFVELPKVPGELPTPVATFYF